jgi:hypothetical protein
MQPQSRSFKHYHQVLGYIIVAFILAQLGLGVKHHLEYRRTQAPTLFGRIHLWMGRLILVLAFVNAMMYVPCLPPPRQTRRFELVLTRHLVDSTLL